MERVLRILDVSSYIYAGSVNTRAKLDGPVVKLSSGYCVRTIAAGGISLIFNELYEHYGTCDYLFCCDRTPTIKQGMYQYYKCSRSHPTKVMIEKEVAEYILKDCGFTLLYEEGYEADDFIYTAVNKFKSQYDKIYIHTADSDLYFLVSDNVEIAKTHSRSKAVTKETYPQMCKSGENHIYNTYTVHKILYGDSSDDIPPINAEDVQLLKTGLYNNSCYKFLGNKDFVRSMVEVLAPHVVPQVDLVFPLDTPMVDDIAKGDKNLIIRWGCAMKNKKFYNKSKIADDGHIDMCISDMINMGLYED